MVDLRERFACDGVCSTRESSIVLRHLGAGRAEPQGSAHAKDALHQHDRTADSLECWRSETLEINESVGDGGSSYVVVQLFFEAK